MDSRPRPPTTAPISEDGPTLAEPLNRTPTRDPYVGNTIDDRYLVERRIGQGGMGVVYVARHKVIDKRFAIKILRVEMVAAPDLVRRFLNEARAASSIGNPHIVDVVDFGQLPDGAPYFVMEYLDGQSLAARMVERRGLPFRDVMRIASEVADGLHAAHEVGIVHRDLKPDNVMLQRGGDHPDFVKVLDFGIAKVGGDSKRLTMAGSVFGTPHYMSPEQCEGKSVDRRTDIYSLGVMMWEMTAGRVPFDAENFMGILSQHMHKAPMPVRELRPDVPLALEAIILRCMAKDPRDRFATMAELIAAIELGKHGVVPASAPSVPRGVDLGRASFSDRSGTHAAVGVPVLQTVPRVAWIALAVGSFSLVSLLFVRYALHRTAGDAQATVPVLADSALPAPSAMSSGSAPTTPVPASNLRTVPAPADATVKRDDIEAGPTREISVAPATSARLQPRRAGEPAQPAASAKSRCPKGLTPSGHGECTTF